MIRRIFCVHAAMLFPYTPRMRSLFFALLLAAPVLAASTETAPLDFQPLTVLPWEEKPTASMQDHLHRIFLEPSREVRYPVLAAYLRQLAVNDLEAAFDHCLSLEGTQHPKTLVSFFLPIWAERDPLGCWKRVEPMFELEDTDWLGHDSWSEEKISFRNLAAMRQSSFWIDPAVLEGFWAGLKRSSLSEGEKQTLRSAFMAKWSPLFSSEPSEYLNSPYESETPGLIEAFRVPEGQMAAQFSKFAEDRRVALQILLRRWLAARPEKAFFVVSIAEKLKAAPHELFMIWLQRSPKTLIEWLDVQIALPEPPYHLMGMTMKYASVETRERWVRRARDQEQLPFILSEWAAWDHEGGMSAAISSRNTEAIAQAAEKIVYGAASSTYNHSRAGLSYIRDFDLSRLPKAPPEELFSGWYILMEQWGEVDLGEAARHGLDFMLKTNYTPREDLLKLFSGDDAFGSDGDMIDRTFCALRMWAVLKPEEMKAWIATRPDADMRKALTWLLHHPWGHDKDHLPR